jgi:putative component of membrane protein insertase Oxa1/YidC/SpoIIIJ protein YidD
MRNLLKLLKVNSFGLLLCLLTSITGHAQNIDFKNDLLLVESVTKLKMPVSTKRVYIYKSQPKTFKNCNPVSLIYGGSLYVYQNLFSQHLSASCLYNPSCSDFSKHAVKEFGLVKGALLSFDRLSRCNRIAATDLNLEEIDKHTHRFNDSVEVYK